MGNNDTCQLCLGINTQIYVSGVFRNRVVPQHLFLAFLITWTIMCPQLSMRKFGPRAT